MEKEEQVNLKNKPNKEKKIKCGAKITPPFDFDIPDNYLYALMGIIAIVAIMLNYIYFSIKNSKENEKIEKARATVGIEDSLLFDYNTLLRNKVELEEYCNFTDQKALEKEEYEQQIILANVSLLNNKFQMYVYRNEDISSQEILTNQGFESDETKNLLTALSYYSSTNDLKPQDIYFLDIGSTIGWYSYFVAKYGYNVLSFEPSDLHNYIVRKSYCLNREVNISFIKRGLNNIDHKCDLYINKKNHGDGFIFCERNRYIPPHLIKSEEVILTKLERYMQFLSTNNLGLVRIDVEGAEEKVLLGGIELISNYQVPFIFLKFNQDNLRLHGTDPKKFLEMFNKYGYLFPSRNFLDDVFLSPNKIIEKAKGTYNLYIVHQRISRKFHDL